MIFSRQALILLIVLIVFTAGLLQGFNIAFKKGLWNDEIYSQVASVEDRSWAYIWSGSIREGNNTPLFYSLQKVVCDLFGYRSNNLWHSNDVTSRYILRIVPVVSMSLGIALIVGFFCLNYFLLGGFIAFIITISSYMVWYYWAEARPYGLMFLATTIQSLVLLHYVRVNGQSRHWTIGLANIILAFVSSLSVIQIAASAVVLWFTGGRRLWSLLWYVGIPMFIAFGYYSRADHYQFFFTSYGGIMNLIQANIPSGRLMAFLVLPILIWAWDWRNQKSKELYLWPFFVWGWLTLLGYFLFLGYLYMIQTPSKGFEVSNRYLMALTPVGIILVTVAILEFIKRPKTKWIKFTSWIIVLAVILPRLQKAWHWMSGLR